MLSSNTANNSVRRLNRKARRRVPEHAPPLVLPARMFAARHTTSHPGVAEICDAVVSNRRAIPSYRVSRLSPTIYTSHSNDVIRHSSPSAVTVVSNSCRTQDTAIF